MRKKRLLALITSCLVFAIGTPTSAYAKRLEFDQIVAFGDSSTDTGKVSWSQCIANMPLECFPVFWAPCNPWDPATALPAYFDDDFNNGFDGNLSDGPLWIERLADALGVERPRASAVGDTNYAYASAKSGPDEIMEPDDHYDHINFNLRVNLFPGNPAWPPDQCEEQVYAAGQQVPGSAVPRVNRQIEQFLTDNGGFAAGQLVVMWVGANDVRDAPLHPSGPQAAIEDVVSNMVTAAATVAHAGGEHIVVPNQANAARAPICWRFAEETKAALLKSSFW